MAFLELNPPTTSQLEVHRLGENLNERRAWDEFVARTPGGMPTMLSSWRGIMAGEYGYPIHFLYACTAAEAESSSQIVGVLPLFEVRSPISGHSLQTTQGGMCAATTEAAQALVNAADALARERNVEYLHLRDSRREWDETGLEAVHLHGGVIRHIGSNKENVWHGLDKDIRRQIRLGLKNDTLRWRNDSYLYRDFYRFFLRFNRRMGTPLFSLRFLQRVIEAFKDEYHLIVGFDGFLPVSGFFNLPLGKTLYGQWGAALPEYHPMYITQVSYWENIMYAIQMDYHEFDFGRAAYPSSQFDFKARWGHETYPIYQVFRVYRGRTPMSLTVGRVDQDRGLMKVFRRVWPKLPVKATRMLGPLFRKHMPFG